MNNNNFKYIIYGHTDFLDMLQIQIDKTKSITDKILIINSNNILTDEILNNFNQILYYEDHEPYATRLLNTISKINDVKYILFSHEIDILLNVDLKVINYLTNVMDRLDIDKIDLTHYDLDDIQIENNQFINISDNYDKIITTNILDDNKNYLVKRVKLDRYLYNVNPTIWKKDSILELLEYCKDKDYRSIEYDFTQTYMVKFNVYNLHTKKPLDCGYFKCLDFYKYFHITHYGKLVRPNKNITTEYNQSFKDCYDDYMEILDKYDLVNGTRVFNI